MQWGKMKTYKNWVAISNLAKKAYQGADESFHGVLGDVAPELSYPTKVVVTDATNVVVVLFRGQLRIKQHF